jgi:4-amino-4-deoxy-L-arabinose transferase-like glycosyltransferase
MEHNAVGLDKGTEIPPLTTWIRSAFASLFGLSTTLLKTVSIIFGLLTITIVYLLAKELYDKRTALIASVLLSLSAWHILGTTSISFDGAFLTLFYLTTIFFFVKYMQNSQKKYLVFTGISFGLAMLTKLNAILILIILFLYALMYARSKSIKTRIISTLKDFTWIIVLGAVLFSIFPIIAALTDWSYFTVVLGHTAVFHNASFNIVFLLIQYMLALLWAGPLFLGIYLVSLFTFEKKDALMHIWIGVIVLFFTFVVQENFRPVERYFLVLLPALCILGGAVISRILSQQVPRRTLNAHIKWFLVAFVLSLVVIFALNLVHNDILPFYPKTAFIDHVIHFAWNFLVPFTGDQGPIGMYVSFSSIAFAFAISLIGLMIFFITRHRNKLLAKNFFLIFLAAGLAFNLFMWQEMVFSSTNPNIDKISKETITYAWENNLPEPVYVFRNYALHYYLDRSYFDVRSIDFGDINNETKLQDVFKGLKNRGTLIIIDFPKIGDDHMLWKYANDTCTLMQKISDKNIPLGYIYTCGKQ